MVSAITRRTLLRNGTLATAAACALSSTAWSKAAGLTAPGASQPPGQPPSQPKIRLGVASYSFHKFDRAHVIDFMHQLNVKYLNTKDVLDHLPMSPPAATQAALDAYKAAGIEVTAAGVIYFLKPDPADIREKFEYVKRAGLSLIVGSPTREVLPMVETFVRQYDIRLAIHNHGPEDKQWPSPLDILAVIQPMDPRIGLCIDVGHTARSGTSVVEAIRKAGPRVFDIHMKDLADMAVKESQVAVGDGKMPVREIFAALNSIAYKSFVDLEYEIQEDDPLPGMIKSFAYMRSVLASMSHTA